MVIKKNVTQTPGVDSNCKNVCLIMAGMKTAVCMAHCAMVVEASSSHPSFCTRPFSRFTYENGYCLSVLMAQENRKVNGVSAQRMDK